jgi:hypothetical protein
LIAASEEAAMTRTLLPPNDSELGAGAVNAHVALEDQAVLDFLRGDYSPALTATAAIDRPHETEQSGDGRVPGSGAEVIYLPAATCCYAIVQYDGASASVVRRVVGLFGDVTAAEGYAHDNSFRLYDVVPATAVIPRTP